MEAEFVPAPREVDRFDLLTEWRLHAPVERIWALLRDVEGWPGWWPSVTSAICVVAGGEEGVGAVHRLAWTTALPYRLAFETRVVAVEPMRRIEVEAFGELAGRGTWTIVEEPDGHVTLRYRWQVTPGKPWMRRLSRLLGPVFAWNHDVVMARGRSGMEARLRDHSPAVSPSAPAWSSPSPSAGLTK